MKLKMTSDPELFKLGPFYEKSKITTKSPKSLHRLLEIKIQRTLINSANISSWKKTNKMRR
jgi:hypothetical protein